MSAAGFNRVIFRGHIDLVKTETVLNRRLRKVGGKRNRKTFPSDRIIPRAKGLMPETTIYAKEGISARPSTPYQPKNSSRPKLGSTG